MNVYDILIVNSSDNPSHYSHYCHPVVIKKVRPLCSASLSSQLFTKQFIFSYKIIFLSSPTGREGIVCSVQKYCYWTTSFHKKKHFSQIFSISVNELCQVLIIKAGNIFCASKVKQQQYFSKQSWTSKCWLTRNILVIKTLAEFLQISDETW